MRDVNLFPWTALARGYRGAGETPTDSSHIVNLNGDATVTPADAAIIANANRRAARVDARFASRAMQLKARVHAARSGLSMEMPMAKRWLDNAESAGFVSDTRTIGPIPYGLAYSAVFGGDIVLNAAALRVLRMPLEHQYFAALALGVGLGAIAAFVGMHWPRDGENEGSKRKWKTLKRLGIPAFVIANVAMGLARFQSSRISDTPITDLGRVIETPLAPFETLLLTTLAFSAIQAVLVAAGIMLARLRAPDNTAHATLAQQLRTVRRRIQRAYKRWKRSAGRWERLRGKAFARIKEIYAYATAAIYEGRDGRSRRHPTAKWDKALQTGIIEKMFAPIPDHLVRSIDPLPEDQLAMLRALGLLAEDPTEPTVASGAHAETGQRQRKTRSRIPNLDFADRTNGSKPHTEAHR